MVVLRVEPAGAELCLPLGLLFLGAPDALLGGPWGLSAAVVAGRTPALGVRVGRGEEGEGYRKGCGQNREEAGLNHVAISLFLRQAAPGCSAARQTNTARRRSEGRAGIQGS